MFNTENLSNKVRPLSKRIVELCYTHKLGHLGSCLTALPILCEIYEKMTPDDIFVLSSGHAAIALYSVLEEVYGHDANKLVEEYGVHPVRDISRNIYCSTGSLGQGITVAIGYALADRRRPVYVLLSDGECFEGSVWESLLFMYREWWKMKMHIYVNMNGYSAISKINQQHLYQSLSQVYPLINIVRTRNNYEPILSELEAHYKILNESEYNTLLEMI